MRRAVVAHVVVRASRTGQIRRQRRRRVRTGDHHHAGSRDQRRSSRRSTRTRRTDHTDHVLVSHDRLGSSLTTISRTQVVKTRPDLNVMTTNLAIVLDGHTDPVLIRNTQERHIARNGIQRTNLDRLTGTNLNSAQRTITQTRRSRSRSRHSSRCGCHSRCRSRSRCGCNCVGDRSRGSWGCQIVVRPSQEDRCNSPAEQQHNQKADESLLPSPRPRSLRLDTLALSFAAPASVLFEKPKPLFR